MTADEFWRSTPRELQYRIEAEAERREDFWDGVRRIMWATGNFARGTTPQTLIPLSRDKITVDNETMENARAWYEKMRKTENKN